VTPWSFSLLGTLSLTRKPMVDCTMPFVAWDRGSNVGSGLELSAPTPTSSRTISNVALTSVCARKQRACQFGSRMQSLRSVTMSSVIRHDRSHHSLLETHRVVQVLWPALHYAIPDAPKTKSFYESASWTQYQSVNQRFADAIIANYREGDISTYT
jgi:trehalose-6-phosphate synthase